MAFPRLPFPAEGISFGDYDNDGWVDMFLTPDWVSTLRDTAEIALYHNEGHGVFVDRTAIISADRPSVPTGFCAPFGDFDNDGDLDLFVPVGYHTVSAWKGPDLLLLNNRGRFENVASQAVFTDSLNSGSALWADFDRDGYLDLFVGRSTFDRDSAQTSFFHNSFFHNNGGGEFTDIADRIGLSGQLSALGGTGGRFVDLDGDGHLDFYATAWEWPNRVLLNNGADSLVHYVSSGASIEGQEFGAAIGDIDKDGDMDIIALAGVLGAEERSALLLNLGEGEFVDITNSAGISDTLLAANTLGAVFADVDNDGNLDLITATPFTLQLGTGDGSFTDATPSAGIADVGNSVAVADWNRDGHLDVVFGFNTLLEDEPGQPGRLFLNQGNTNHWLSVEVVGTQSNRNGVGARVAVRAGDRQVREIYGGTGHSQHEIYAHFGLGARATVDTLEIRWPSGQVDVLTGIPVDQRIRVIEGQGRWAAALPSAWETPPPATVEFGAETLLSAIVRPALFEPTAEITSVTADLSNLGGPQAVPLEDLGDGRYQLVSQLVVDGESDVRSVDIVVLQATSLGEHWINLSRNVEVVGAPITAVLESMDATVPESFTLSQNYPNPFNPETTIRFDLPLSADVDLSLYNLAGQRVATLASGLREAGSYDLRWDGRDDAGRALASGMYFYRLIAGDQVGTRKLMLLR
ncbi:MAG: T9SS type A sorting domain-containing protein [Gemmatimonadetes bacterium]|nr:T9SS type A sorting domain-containing protein [Gemmatimonadota bacterium]MBT5058236.1 T9SS type A sorting domain-containing protein [Gemmatimonadota bacterium]MBT5142327.1 T9SS type A sorting domain-containing protein [Gemmatimonadota bacterium]MBT5589088.1 T9SS type A sorting domain-containing protein [Gemmatimonadota bacterium]MBT5960179.1 T9SS type A sorting domain-containing protein [Gemmatimonadota bacterium]